MLRPFVLGHDQDEMAAVPPQAAELLDTLRGWVAAEALRPLDRALTRFIAEQGGEADPAVLLAVALTSERNGHGHVCLDLRGVLRQPTALLGHLRDDQALSAQVRQELAGRLQGLTLPDWRARLAGSAAVSDWLGARVDDGVSPLVLAGTPDQPLLYLRRYWHYENRIRAGIQARLRQPHAVDLDSLRGHLEQHFDPVPPAATVPDWQRIACALAARSAFFIITGGPGTGKTTTVVRLLAVLQGLATAAGTGPLHIELAAPTGKAAARLNESIAGQVNQLSAQQVPAGGIPTRVKTLHRLLGTIPDSRHFRHHAAHPLPADVVVVDEASMVDVELMARLLEALRPDARLILLGDKDQLSSVEAGAVLGDLCQRAADAHYRPEVAAWLEAAVGQPIPRTLIDAEGTDLDQAVVMLRQSYRFSPQGGIGALGALVNAPIPEAPAADSRLDATLALFAAEAGRQDPDLGVIALRRLADPGDPAFKELVLAGYGGEDRYLRLMHREPPRAGAEQAALDAWARGLLEAQKRFQLLTPLRQGPWGVEGLNQAITEYLAGQGLLVAAGAQPPRPRQWFAGRPVLVTRNDYGLNLMNGDIGLTLSVPLSGPRSGSLSGSTSGSLSESGLEAPGAAGARVLRVAFPTDDGGVRWVLPSRLQAVETVFAMTVHKSQGSEFTHTALLLPDQSNPVLTRELLYTAITRAKQRFTLLYSREEVLGEALLRRVERVSGLQGEGGALDTVDGC